MMAFMGGSGSEQSAETTMAEEGRQLLAGAQMKREGEGWTVETRSGQYHFADDGRMKVAHGSAELSAHQQDAITQHIARLSRLGSRR